MLREFAATLRRLAVAGATPPAAATFALLLVAAPLAGCGIKGPLRLPPPAAAPAAPAAPDATVAPAASTPPATPKPAAPAADPAAPAKP